MSDTSYQPGDEVRCLDTPGAIGVVLKVWKDPQYDEWMARVRVSGRVKMLAFDELEPAGLAATEPWQDVARGVLSSARDLRTLLTHERLRHPPGPVGASFGSARATLYPFQFKPLVKFLENPSHTLLIADEVGLGKTIETGYILREWKLRQRVETVLVVVPARLRTKWRDELARRFDEHFEIVSARQVRALLRQVRAGRELEPFQWVASYESLRLPDIIAELREISPPLDFVVLDEAHRVRNRSTHQYRLARSLAQCAHAMVYLTATPVQTKLADLHTLLDLLQPDAFGSADHFEQLIAANRPIVRAASLAASGRFGNAAAELRTLRENRLTRRLAGEPVVVQLLQELDACEKPSRAERVSYQAAIADLSLTGHMITRTRKVEVFEDRARRTAMPVHIALSDEERRVYDVVRDVTNLLYPEHGSWARTMAALTAYRYTASCIPAGIAYMRERLRSEGILVGGLSGELDDDLVEDEIGDDDERVRVPAAVVARVSDVLALCPPPERDSKLQKLLDTLQAIWRDDTSAHRPRRKVLVFSFFKRTLAYLVEQLDRFGVSNLVIHGGVPIDEREERIEQFVSGQAVDVLLSSEVGGEGLDLQAASVVVNYDLPWNPMVVEQRIGRVDRIGQASDRIVIVNLVCADTVEDRILHRLYERVGLFEATVGEMEEILGSREIRDLVVAELRGTLTPAELSERVEQTAQAALRKRRAAEDLSVQVDGLLAADQAILDEIRLLVDGHRLASAQDIDTLLRGFLEREHPGVRFAGDPVDGIAELELPPTARTALQKWTDHHSPGARRLVGEARRGAIRFTVSAEVAMRHPRAHFVQARHPLIQFAVDAMSERAMQEGMAFGATIRTVDVSPGLWLAKIWTVCTRGAESRTLLGCAAAPVGSEKVLVGDGAEPLLRALLDEVDDIDPAPVLDPVVVEATMSAIDDAFSSYIVRLDRDGLALEERRQLRRRATWDATLAEQVRRAREHLDRMREGDRPAFAVRMAEAKLRVREQEYARVTEEFEAKPSFRVVPTELALVLVDVRSAH